MLRPENDPMKNEFYHVQSVVRTEDYDEEKVYSAVCRHFEALHVKEEMRPDLKVLVKPNLIAPKKPETVATTHPSIVKAVVRWLKENGVEHIIVADSPGGIYTPEYLKNAYHVSQLDETVKGFEGAEMNFDTSFVSVPAESGFANHSFNIIKPIAEADYIINLPKLKTHAMTGMSAGIKNMFGAIPGLQKPQMHYLWPELHDFSNMLVELNLVIRPNVILIDAVDAMEGDGPTGGSLKHVGVTLASRDPYTQDLYAAQMMGLVPESIEMLNVARDKGLICPEETRWEGDELPTCEIPFLVPKTISLDFTSGVPGFLKGPWRKFAGTMLKSYPKLNPDKCVGCMKCQSVCPAQIIKQKDGKPKFTKKGCISCFCCQEMCPKNAIDVKKAL